MPSKYPSEVRTEALRLARDVIRNEIRSQGHKLSHYSGKEIFKQAKELLAEDYYHNIAEKMIALRKAAIGRIAPHHTI